MTTIILIAVLGAAALLGIGCFAVMQRRSTQASFVHFRCPGCKQRLRYQAGKAGRAMICPQCFHRSKLPLAG
ncbi:MAG TPA: hypothetical protein VGZ47_20920 [Gemmataceae bacterium]|nr:hypothetical protein [Gemmataceae bacterium]